MIDPETGRFEIVRYNEKYTATIANLVEQTWLCRYPCPTIITYDQGNEFMGHAFRRTNQKTDMELSPSVQLRQIHKQIQYYK